MAKQAKIIIFSVAVLIGVFGAGGARAFSLGETINFYVDQNYDGAGRAQISATLIKAGQKSLIYVDDNWWRKASDLTAVVAAIDNLSYEFDNVIYPRLTKVYGSEWSPGIDNESRIVILIAQMKEGTGGYFNSADEYFRSQISGSNEKEMLYMNSLYLGTAGMKGYLAHEFHHLINFYQKEKLRGAIEDIWLNEALSEYALTLCGYDTPYQGSHLERRVNEFARNPSDSLTEWKNLVEDYAPINLFMQYFVARYGENILTRMITSSSVGIVEINDALSELGYQDRFADVFANWIVADYLNNCQAGSGQKYCYLNPQLNYNALHVAPSVSGNLTAGDGAIFSYSDRIKDWSGHWYDVAVSRPAALNLIIDFKGAPTGSFAAPYIIYYSDGAVGVGFLKLDGQQAGRELIPGLANPIKNIVLMPLSESKKNNFSADEPARSFSFSLSFIDGSSLPPIISPSPTPSPLPVKQNYPDGSLLRAAEDFKVYVINGPYKRWIQSSQIFSFYPHFGWQQVIEVSPEQLAVYRDAALVRADGDPRVYEINGDGTKHWLDMSAEKFAESGRLWDMVFIINKAERDWYKTGANVMK